MPTLDEILPRVLPAGWHEQKLPREVLRYAPGARAFLFVMGNPRRVMVTLERHENGREWIHLSLAGQHRLPSWESLKEARDLFLAGRAVVQFLPEAKDWTNVHEHCLHLWAPLDGRWPTEFWSEGNR